MKKKILLLTILSVLIITFSAVAVELDDFDKELFVRVFKDVESEDVEYMARLGLDSEDISLILYYYSNSDKKLDRNELDKLVRNRERISEFHKYYGLPPIIFGDELVRFRHPARKRHFPPLDTHKYDKKYKFNGGTEIIKVRGPNYNYKYNNRHTGVEEKIEIKKQKYEYYYKSNNMVEKLSVHHANNKYEYYYKNFNTGRTIKKSGRGRRANKKAVYEELRERYRNMDKDDDWNDNDYDEDKKEDDYDKDDNDEDEVNIQFDIKIDLSDILN